MHHYLILRSPGFPAESFDLGRRAPTTNGQLKKKWL